MNKPMISKYPGVCKACHEPVRRGDSIVYRGKGQGITCADCASSDDVPQADEDDSADLERGTLASDRRLARQGLTVVRFSSGESFTQNSRGRCEDAPCCGCCG